MKPNLFRFIAVLLIGGLALTACNMPASATATEEPTQPGLSAIELAATQTQLAALVASPTVAAPTDTPVPAETATETLTPEPSVTPTVEVPVAEIAKETNCRIGPSGAYDLVATYQAGQKVEIVARDLGGGFLFVKNLDKPEELCYVLANNLKITGDPAVLPQYTPLPSPTAAPGFTIKFKKFEICKGEPFAVFIIENTGSVPFRSAYIKVTDQKVNKSVEQAVNAFDQYAGCVIAKNIAPLASGASGFVNSPVFKTWDPRPNKLRATIMACTEKDLKGFCMTQGLDIKP